MNIKPSSRLLARHTDIFDDSGPLRQTRFIKHDIVVTDPKPFRLPPYRYSAAKKKAIQEQIKEMLASGVIESSSSPYSSPIVMALKKDGEFRFCVDFRHLNGIMEDSAQPLPVIHEVLKDLGEAPIFSTLDLRSGYWQIPLTDRAKKYTAFVTPDGGQYAFKLTPFRLQGAGRMCTQLVGQKVLASLMRKCCMHYLDDICVYSKNWTEHLQHLALVFERLSTYGLASALEKCTFSRPRLEYLSQVVTAKHIEAKSEHARAVLEAQVPRSRKDLRAFFGVCGWLREYVPDFTAAALPLTALLAQRKVWRWTEVEQKAFDAVKLLFRRPLILCRPDLAKRFFLQTDAAKSGMGAVLYQEGDDGDGRIVSYASAKFTPAESKYHSNEQECLAVVWTLKKYRALLEDNRFTLRTDNAALTWLDRVQDERGKLTRWAMLLKRFSFDVEHVPGKNNELPDALSRQPGDEVFVEHPAEAEVYLPPERIEPEEPEFLAFLNTAELYRRIIRAQTTDPQLRDENRQHLVHQLREGQDLRC
jgi:hypothetical protein